MKKVLIADDESHILNLVKMTIEQAGYSVITAADGGEALMKIHQEKPVLVIMDLMMPVIDGFHLLYHLRYEDDVQPIPKVILLTCRTSDKDKILGQNIGADAYITKPFKAQDIINKVRELLAESPE